MPIQSNQTGRIFYHGGPEGYVLSHTYCGKAQDISQVLVSEQSMHVLCPPICPKLKHLQLSPTIQLQGIWIMCYLEDWLIIPKLRKLAETHTRIVINHISNLGFLINWKKCCLTPRQQTSFLELNSLSMHACLTVTRQRCILTAARALNRSQTVRAGLVMLLLGLMVAALAILPLGLLCMRPLQRWFISQRIHLKRNRYQLKRNRYQTLRSNVATAYPSGKTRACSHLGSSWVHEPCGLS